MSTKTPLTREQKELRLQALQEKIRRAKNKKPPFRPNPGQLPVLKSEKLIRLVTSGNGSGKTVLSVVEAVWTCQGYNPVRQANNIVPTKVIYVLDKPSKVSDKIVPEMKKFFDTSSWGLHKDGTPGIRRISFPNGSEMVFMFHDQDPMSFESLDGYSLVVYDEPPPRHVFIALARGGRSKGFKTKHVFAGTPIGSNSAWLRMELLESWKNGDPDIDVFQYGTEVNADNLDDGYIESFSKRLSEKEKAIRLRGEWSDLDGLALAHLFDPKVHLIPEEELALWDRSNPCVVAIDPHPSKKHFAILLGVDRDNQLVVLKEMAKKEVARDYARSLKEFMRGYRVIEIVCDNLGSAEMTGGEGFKSFIEVLREEGIRVRPTRYDEKADDAWVSRMQDAFVIPSEADTFGRKLPRLRMSSACRMLISDVKNVSWMKIKNLDEYKPTLDITNKDALSCLKYALALNLFFDKPQRMKPVYRPGSMYGVTPTGPERQRAKIKARLRARRHT